MKNVKLKEGFSQVCIWPACIVNDKEGAIEEFEKWMKDEFDCDVQYLEEIKTKPDLVDGEPVLKTGDRNDLLFAVHDKDVGKFALKRLVLGIRWIEDVLAPCNYKSPIYPERVFDYKCWNEGDEEQ